MEEKNKKPKADKKNHEELEIGKKARDPRHRKIDIKGNYGIDGVSHDGNGIIVGGGKRPKVKKEN